jgi:hypothetical protein
MKTTMIMYVSRRMGGKKAQDIAAIHCKTIFQFQLYIITFLTIIVS